jgi:hypothetical protein
MDEPYYCGHIQNIFSCGKEILSVELYHNAPPGQRKNLISVTRSTNMGGDWAEIGLMCPNNARALASHLANAADIAEAAETEVRAGITGVRRLPSIVLCGTEFFIDERLRQLRSVENPAHFFDLEDRIWQ